MNTRKQAPGMEGAMARWYAKQRGSDKQLEQVRTYAASEDQAYDLIVCLGSACA